jgi:hypothetical protein
MFYFVKGWKIWELAFGSINNDEGIPNVQNASLVMNNVDKMPIEWNEKENDLNISCKNQPPNAILRSA